MVLTLNISSQIEALLRQRATREGVDLHTFALRQLETLALTEPHIPSQVQQLSGSAQEEFLASGLTDDQFGDFLETAKHEMRRGEQGPT